MDMVDTFTGASKASLKNATESLLDAVFEGIEEAIEILVAKAFDSSKDRALLYVDDDTLEGAVAAMFDDTRDMAFTLAKTLLERARDMKVVFASDALRLDISVEYSRTLNHGITELSCALPFHLLCSQLVLLNAYVKIMSMLEE